MPDGLTPAWSRSISHARGLRAARPLARRSRALRALQYDVLGAIASGQRLGEVTDLLCRRVESLLPGVVCSLVAVEEGRLRSLAGPSLPAAYAKALDGTPIGPEVGSCGAAAFLRRPVESQDLATDPNWATCRDVPLQAGLLACWSSPIIDPEGRVAGSFAFYYRTCRGPTAMERRIVHVCADLCLLAMRHDSVWGRLELANHRFDVALSHMSQGLCFFDRDRRLIVANRRFSEIYGLDPKAIEPGTTLEEIVALRVAAGSGPAMVPDAYLGWRETVQTTATPTDTVVELANGRMIAIHHRPMPDHGWVATHEDITERRRAEAQVVHMARHDGLTGLPNRVMFQERMDEALSRLPDGEGCALLCVDLDRFKAVNDTFGHPCGDTVLRDAARRLLACVRQGDTVTRLGGDEFGVLLRKVSGPEVAGQVAARVVAALSEAFEMEGHSAGVGASVGIALAPTDGANTERLMKSADTALYRAKLEQRGTFRFFEAEMDSHLAARAALERDFRDAVRDGGFQLAFQPMLDVEANRVTGFEALLRWTHAERGVVTPDQFIPLAEETGLIVPLGRWVLRTACAEAAQWPPSVKVAVNLSAVQFRTGGLVDVVAAALQETGLAPGRLELEITESVLLHDSADTLTTLHRLRALGVTVSLDDFGTGYSALSYLRSFPFDRIKIDQSFIRDLSDKQDSIAITRAIVGLGRSLGIATTAEGVETAVQLEHLRREGCKEVQGHLFSRAVPAAAARQMLDDGVHRQGHGRIEGTPAAAAG